MNINLTIIGQILAFIAFVAFCMRYVWPPILAAMEERQQKIADGLAAADRAHQQGVPARALPLACVTEQAQGKQLAEMHDLSEAGAVAFTDDAPQDRVGVPQRALTYGEVHQKTIVDDPLDQIGRAHV